MAIDHAISIKLEAHIADRQRPPYLVAWKSWLLDPQLDKRICGLKGCETVGVTFGELIDLLQRRKDDHDCQPITDISFIIPPTNNYDQLLVALRALSPSLRRLSIVISSHLLIDYETMIDSFASQELVDHLDLIVPNLRELCILYSKAWEFGDDAYRPDSVTSTKQSVSGLPNLRLFTLAYMTYEDPAVWLERKRTQGLTEWEEEKPLWEMRLSDRVFGHFVSGLGVGNCVIRNLEWTSAQSEYFNRMIPALKRCVPTLIQDLGVNQLILEPDMGRAWSRTSRHIVSSCWSGSLALLNMHICSSSHPMVARVGLHDRCEKNSQSCKNNARA